MVENHNNSKAEQGNRFFRKVYSLCFCFWPRGAAGTTAKMSVVRTKVLGLVDVIMRVPSLFIIDEILKISMGLPNSSSPPPTQSAATAAVTSSESLVNLTVNATVSAATNMLDAAAAAAATAGGIGSPEDSLKDDIEFYKFISLTTLKFLLCLFGKSRSRGNDPFIRAGSW